MLNSISLVGRMVRDPEYRALADGTGVCNFTIAVDDNFKDKNGEYPTDFIDCTAWKQKAEYVAKYAQKGTQLSVNGRLKSRKWEDKEGNKRTNWFVKCENVDIVGSKKERSEQGAPAPAYAPDNNPYQETEAMIAKYTAQRVPDDYAMLTDDDAQLPF